MRKGGIAVLHEGRTLGGMYPKSSAALRAAALIILLALVPASSALTVSATYNGRGSGDTAGSASVGVFGNVTIAPFDTALGTLHAVNITTVSNLQFTTIEYAHFGPRTVGLSIFGSMTSFAIGPDPDSFIVSPNSELIAIGGPIVDLAQGESTSLSGTIAKTFVTESTDPELLGFLSSAPLVLQNGARVGATNFFGGAFFTLATETVVTYTYTVPESGNAPLLFAIAIFGILQARKRFAV